MWYSQEPYQGMVTHKWRIITIKEVLLEKWEVSAPHWAPHPQPAPGRPAPRTLDFEGAYFWKSQDSTLAGCTQNLTGSGPRSEAVPWKLSGSDPPVGLRESPGDAGGNWSSPWGRSAGNNRFRDRLVPQTRGESQRPFWSLPPLKRIRSGSWPRLPARWPRLSAHWPRLPAHWPRLPARRHRNWDPLAVSLTRQGTCVRSPCARGHWKHGLHKREPGPGSSDQCSGAKLRTPGAIR